MSKAALVGVCLQFFALIRVQYEIVRKPGALGPLSFGAIATAGLTWLAVLLLHADFPRLALGSTALNLIVLMIMLGNLM